MSNILRVEQYSEALAALLKKAQELGVYAIGRVQDSVSRSLSLTNGRLENISNASISGIGVHVFTPAGYSSFACSDEISPAVCRELVETAAHMAKGANGFGTQSNRAIFEVESNGVSTCLSGYRSSADIDYNVLLQYLAEANQNARTYAASLSVRTQFALTDSQWRIVRSDGTDVSFDQPTALATNLITTASGIGSHAVSLSATVSGADDSILLDPISRLLWQQRTRNAAHLVAALPHAPLIKGGSYKLVIDYALAKGLAHEAFGHASESDIMVNSVLGQNGKMRLGEKLGADIITITDGSLPGDYAYQPISANGNPRQTVNIIQDGVLNAGLADLFSAERAGMVASGAERIESYRHLPLPRMSNIRIRIKDPASFDRPFEEITPAELRARLLETEYLKEGETCLYLAGYSGGQVMPKEGDFVFNCNAIYDLSMPEPMLYQPAIFSGKILSALSSIQGGLGTLHLDAQGYCGKGSQSVPSSGGSHSFLVMERSEQILIGGV